MDIDLSILLFFALFAVWVYLPFAPALCELWTLEDDLPVEVVQDSEVDIRHFADGYRSFLEANLADELARCREEGRSRAGQLDDGSEFLVVPGSEGQTLPLAEPHSPCRTMVLSTGELELPPDGVYFAELYARGTVHSGERCVVRALLSEDDIELGAANRSLRWLHARGVVIAGEGCWLHGRASAGERIELAAGCRFERLQAPEIRFGPERPTAPWQGERRRIDPAELPGEVKTDVAAGRWLVRKSLDLPDGAELETDLVVTGDTRLGAGARVAGSVKSHGDLHLGPGTEIEGSAVAGRDLYLAEGCRVRGPVLAERTVRVGAGCRIGSQQQPSTLSAAGVRMAEGVVVHGTAWAHESGLLEPGRAARLQAPPERRLYRQLERARYRGFRGGFISLHRALRISPLGPAKLGQALALAVLTLGAWYGLLPWVTRFWGATMVFWTNVLGLLGSVDRPATHELAGVVEVEVPYVHVLAGPPTILLWKLGLLLCALLVGISLLLPKRYLPLAYFLRIAAAIQACSQVFFAVWPDRFPYTAGGYVHTMLVAGLFLITLVPVVLAFTYYLFDFSLGRKIALTLMMMGHLAVLIPWQYVVHIFVLYHLSLLFMPLLFFVFGLLPGVFVFIALYGLGFSWPHPLHHRPAAWHGAMTRAPRSARSASEPLPRRLGALLCAGLLGAAAATASEPTEADAAGEPKRENPWVRSIELGGGFLHYTGEEGDGNGQFARLTWSKPHAVDFRVDAGRQERFGETTTGIGVLLTRHFKNKTSVRLGAGASTGELAPELSLGLSVSRPFFDITWTLGVGRDEYTGGTTTDRLSLGAQRWFSHWIVGASIRHDLLSPGDVSSTSANLGVTYYQWKKLYVSFGHDFGKVSYTPLGEEGVLVDYTARGFNVGYSRWFDSTRGVNLRLDWGEPPEAVGLTVSFFREW